MGTAHGHKYCLKISLDPIDIALMFWYNKQGRLASPMLLTL
jgi:hypothetical protein